MNDQDRALYAMRLRDNRTKGYPGQQLPLPGFAQQEMPRMPPADAWRYQNVPIPTLGGDFQAMYDASGNMPRTSPLRTQMEMFGPPPVPDVVYPQRPAHLYGGAVAPVVEPTYGGGMQAMYDASGNTAAAPPRTAPVPVQADANLMSRAGASPGLAARAGGTLLRGAGVVGAGYGAAQAASTLADAAQPYLQGAGGVSDPMGDIFGGNTAPIMGGGGTTSMPMAQAVPLAAAQVLGVDVPLAALGSAVRPRYDPGRVQPYVAGLSSSAGPVNSRGQGFADPRMIRAPQGYSAGPVNSRGQGFDDPRMIRAPQAPVPVPRPAPRPAPVYQAPASYDNGGVRAGPHTGVDDVARVAAMRALGILP